MKCWLFWVDVRVTGGSGRWDMGWESGGRSGHVALCISFVCEQRAHGCHLENLCKAKGGVGLVPTLPTCRDPCPSDPLSQDPCFWLELWSHLSWKGHLVRLPCSEQGCAQLHQVLTAASQPLSPYFCLLSNPALS